MKKTVTTLAFGLLATGAWLAACSSDDGQTDGGGTDSGGKPDSTLPDSGKMDSSTNDTGVDTGVDTGTGMDGGTEAGGFDFWVVRVGTGMNDAAAGNESNAVFIEQRNSSDGMIAKTIALPTGANDGGGPFASSGSATSEGDLQLSGDGHYVTLAGYSIAPGIASIASSTSSNDGGVSRTVARIDKNGVIDTTTRFDAFSANNVRSATANDGTAFWVIGANTGVVYVPLGNGATTNIESTATNIRSVAIAGGQLYIGASAGIVHGIATVGTGLPTTGNQTVTALPGLDNTDGGVKSNYSFQLVDLDANVAGLDTAYIADDSAPASNGGIQKWKFNGNTWTMARVFNDGLLADGGAAKGCYHVVTKKVGNDIHVVCSTTDTTLNYSRLVRYVDDGMVMSPSGTVIATAPQGTFFRGVSLPPN